MDQKIAEDNPTSGTEHPHRELERRIFHLKTLYDLSQEVVFLRCTEEIIRNLLMMIVGTFGVLNGVILLIDIKRGKVEAISHRGMDHASVDILSRAIESGHFSNVKGLTGVQILGNGGNIKGDGGVKILDLLSSLNISIWIPFEVDENLKCGIGLGDRLLGEPYTPDDQELLTTLASHGAIAIKNARLVEQMKREERVRTNLARYLSPQIVERIIHKDMQVNLGGHKSVVTVLFSDIRNFTPLTESLQPDQLVHILNEYFTEMARIIFDHQGSLDKYIGDAIVSVFGSLIPLENSARNAVVAATQMMRRLPALNEKWNKEFGVTISIGIGINTGEVFLGNIGSPERMEFTVIGDTVNVASRFSGLAKAGQILLTREALNCVGEEIRCNALPPCEVKGKTGKIEIFEVFYPSLQSP